MGLHPGYLLKSFLLYKVNAWCIALQSIIIFVKGHKWLLKAGGQEFKFLVVFLIDLSYKPLIDYIQNIHQK